MKDIKQGGIKVYMFCDGFVDTFISVLKTLLCFIGGLGNDPDTPGLFNSHVPQYMVNANLEFLNNTMGIIMEDRTNETLDIEDFIQSGDYLTVMRLDGLAPIVMYGSGAHASHATMALRFPDGELYIVES